MPLPLAVPSTCVKPSSETIQDGSYKPLSRPLFMYPSAEAIQRPEVKAFMDFVIANQAVIAPVYGEKGKGLMLDALKALFPERAVIGLPSRALLTGGGSFHCITQQEPA